MKQIFVIIVTILSITGCNDSGHLLEYKQLNINTKEHILEAIKESKYIDRTDVHYSYTKFAINYSTEDVDGSNIAASGTISIPNRSEDSYTIVINCHPTIFLNSLAPTQQNKTAIESAIYFTANSGFITLEPDYIGFGSSKDKKHLYFIKKQSTKAVTDFVKASIEFLKLKGISVKNIYLTGYSEGAYVALSSLGTLEDMGYNIKITLPIAGVYTLEPIASKILKYKRLQKPSIITAIAKSYATKNGIELNKFINSRYIDLIKNIYDGNHSKEYIDKALPKSLKGQDGLFLDSFITNYNNSWLQNELKRNNALELFWKSKIEFLNCLGDKTAPIKLATLTKDILNKYYFKSSKVVPVESFISQNLKTKLRLNHKECATPAYKIANFIFKIDSQKR